MGPGVVLAPDTVEWPVINDAGQVVFVQKTAGPGIDPAGGWALFGGPADGATTALVRPGDPVAGSPDLRLTGPGNPFLNDANQLLFTGTFADGGAASSVGVFGAGALGEPPHLLARVGGPAHGVAGSPTFADPIGAWKLTEAGQVIMGASLEGTGIVPKPAAYFVGPVTGSSADIHLLGSTPGHDVSPAPPVIWVVATGPGNQVLFHADDGRPAPPFPYYGGTLFRGKLDADGNLGDVVPALAYYAQAPGMPPGVRVNLTVNDASINSAGRGVITADVGTDMNLNHQPVVYLIDESGARPILKAGDPVAGIEGAVFSGAPTSPTIDDAGNVTFVGTATLPGNVYTGGVFSGPPGAYRLVARSGQQAPGMPPGVTMRVGSHPVVNSRGQIVFDVWLDGPGIVEDVSNHAIVASDTDGQLHLVARTGDPIELPDGTVRTMHSFWYNHATFDGAGSRVQTNGVDGRPSSFNNAGQLVFYAQFTGATDAEQLSGAMVVADVNGSSRRVVGRHAFYDNSLFDGHRKGPGAGDDDAVAPDKQALLAGADALPTFANYTSYSKGLNGLMVDVPALPAGGREVSADDFEFRLGNGAAAPAPSAVSVRPGAGDAGSDRITLTWPDGAIRNTWLRVTVKATPHTGLAAADVFSFGNLVGETGNRSTAPVVDLADLAAVRRRMSTPSTVAGRFDFDRDGKVAPNDYAIARSNYGRRLPITDVGAASATSVPARRREWSSGAAITAQVLA
jgi:hypothetical protein